MSTKYKFRNPDGIYFITFAVVEWVDVFTRPVYKNLIIENLTYCTMYKGLNLHAYVIMSNHIHLVASAERGALLQNILRDFKKFTAYKLIGLILEINESRKEWMIQIFKNCGSKNPNNTKYQFWRQDNHPIELTDNRMMDQKVNYIHNNPVAAGIVAEPEHYLYSSARNYANVEFLMDIEMIE